VTEGRRAGGEMKEKRGFIKGARVAEERLEDAACSSALHNTALVVNSMTFGQNAAVSPYDGDAASQGAAILSYMSSSSPLPMYIPLFLSSRLAAEHT